MNPLELLRRLLLEEVERRGIPRKGPKVNIGEATLEPAPQVEVGEAVMNPGLSVEIGEASPPVPLRSPQTPGGAEPLHVLRTLANERLVTERTARERDRGERRGR